tara:strand:+ start:1345 stop:1554 length:210 start_codon:yes stop_codon:yes gene_type:complete
MYPFSDESQGKIRVTDESLSSLKELHREALNEDQMTFMFNDMELDVNYASYLITHMENILNLDKKENYA